MTEHPEPDDTVLGELLKGMASTAKAERHANAGFQAMASATSIGQVVRRVRDGHTNLALDAFDVLQGTFGLAGTADLYEYLAELPHRFRTYEAAYRAETHSGCVDRAVAKCTEDIQMAAGAAPRPIFGISPRASHAALAAKVDEPVAQDVLNVASMADDGKRIQRLSVDTGEITRRILAQPGFARGVDARQLRATVRLVLITAAEVVHAQDGVDVE